jgi:hypothetical protein
MKLAEKQVKVKALLALCAGFILAACSSPDTNTDDNYKGVLTGTVSITGTAQVGQTLTADTFNLNGSGSLRYRWLRDNEPISGATGISYTLVETDRGARIKVEVKREGYSGSITSNPTAPVAGIDDPPLTGTVRIEGTIQVGQTLTADTSGLNGSGSLSYLWYRDDSPISGAAGNSYTLGAADRGKYIKVEVSRSGYTGVVTSSPRGPIAGSGESPVLYEKAYWGEWIRVDNGDMYYFSSSHLTIKVENSDNGQISQPPGGTLTIESENVITGNDNGKKYWLYASRPATAGFSGRVVDNRQAAGRSARASVGGMAGIIRNIKNPTIEVPITPNPVDGKFEVLDIVAGDDYEISFPDAPEIPPIPLYPGYDGDDIGNITIIEGVNLKISIRAENSDTTDITRLYANLTPYNLVIDIENVGTEECLGATFSLNFGDLVFSPANYDHFLNTILPGAKKSVPFSIACPNYTEQESYKYKKIEITIEDSRGSTTWEDSVQLQFHKAPVDFNIRSERELQGVIRTPRQKAYNFKCDAASGYSDVVTLPWTLEPYIVVFSFATFNNETRYSMGINVTPDTNFTDLQSSRVHEENDTAATAYVMDVKTEPKIMSYIDYRDIDYFSVYLDPNPFPVYITLDTSDGAYTVSGDNNGDGAANPGETFNLNLKIKNTGIRNADGVTARLIKPNSDNSAYLSVYETSKYIGSLTVGGTPVNAAFQMNVSSSCPAGTDIPLQMEFTGSGGDKWLSNFNLHIYPPRPANVKAEALSETSVRVSWDQAAGATGYKVYNPGGSLIATINGNANTQYEHTNLNAAAVYEYRVSAVAETDESVKSPVVSARTWERLAFNRQYNGTASADVPHYYRFSVTSGVTYAFTSDVSASVKYETGNALWFNLSSGTASQTASQSGWAYIKLESADAYSLKVKHPEAGVNAFSIGSNAGTVGEADKTIAVNVPFGTNLTNLTPSVTPASGWTSATTGAKNFTNPVEYSFTKGDVTQIYTVTVTPNGQGGITINPPPVTDITIEGFPTAPFTVSRSGSGGYLASRSITLTGSGYSSIEWWIGEANKTSSATYNGMAFVVQAASCTLGEHTLTVIVYKAGIPYSNEINFTVVQ